MEGWTESRRLRRGVPEPRERPANNKAFDPRPARHRPHHRARPVPRARRCRA